MIAAWQGEKHAFSHLFVNKSSWQASNTNARVLFSFLEHVVFNLMCTVKNMSLDTDTIIVWKLSRFLNDNKRFIEWWKGHIAQHLTGKAPYDGNDELYWEMDLYRNDELSWELDLFGNAGGKIAMD